MRIGVFTDAHYSSQKVTCGKRYNSRSLQKIQTAYDCFLEKNCELIICLGDLIDTEPTVELEIANLRAIATVMHNCPIPTVCLMGNHDAFVLTPHDFYSILNLQPPKDMCIRGCNFVFLDACYFKSGKHYAPGDTDWKDSYLPNEENLRTRLGKMLGKTYVFVHQNMDPNIQQKYRIFNADKIMEIMEQSGKVNTVFQGHYHAGARSEHNGVKYVTLPAMCENEQGFWILDL